MLGKIEGRRRIGRQRMVGWHHRLNGHEFELTPGDGEGQGSLACCSPWIAKSQTRLSNNNKGEAPSIKTDVNSPCVYLLTLIVSMYFLPSFTRTPCPAKSFMPEACGHIPYRAVMVWICCFCGQNLDLLVGGFLSLFGVMETTGCRVRDSAQQGIFFLSLNFLVCKMWLKSINLL